MESNAVSALIDAKKIQVEFQFTDDGFNRRTQLKYHNLFMLATFSLYVAGLSTVYHSFIAVRKGTAIIFIKILLETNEFSDEIDVAIEPRPWFIKLRSILINKKI